VFALALALGAGGIIAAAAALTTAIASVHRTSTSYEAVLAGFRFTYPAVNSSAALLLAIAALGAAAVTMAARASWRQGRQYRGFIGHIGPLKALEKDPRVKVIADPRPQAFCAGLLRPTVYVSQRTIELLTDTELDAVLAHEHHHRRVRDPLRFACGRILSEALFFVPVLRPLCDRYSDLAELSADRAAVRASAGRQAPLASALLLFDESGPPGVTGISPERVDSLQGQPVKWGLPLSLLAASIAALSAISLLVWGTSGAASAQATFNLPILSSEPCVVMATILPFMGCLKILTRTAARRKRDGQRR
jgi:Zn-dependent protease with chaperone function